MELDPGARSPQGKGARGKKHWPTMGKLVSGCAPHAIQFKACLTVQAHTSTFNKSLDASHWKTDYRLLKGCLWTCSCPLRSAPHRCTTNNHTCNASAYLITCTHTHTHKVSHTIAQAHKSHKHMIMVAALVHA